MKSKTGTILILVYAGIVVLAIGLAMYGLVFDTANSELSFVFPLIVSLPWSLLLQPFWEWLGFIHWYGQFAGNPALYGFFATLTIVPGVAANAFIVYFIGRLFDGSSSTK